MVKRRISFSIVAVILIGIAAVLVDASTAPKPANSDEQDDAIRTKGTVRDFNKRINNHGNSGASTVQLRYRLRDAPKAVISVATDLGYAPMIEIPPRDFLQRNTIPHTPKLGDLVNAARIRIGGPNPENYTGWVQADYEEFQELRKPYAAESYARRLSVISALRGAFPQAKISSYGVLRLISNEPNSYMSLLQNNVDYFNVVCYRKGKTDSNRPSQKSLQKFKKNLDYVRQFNKPVVVTISPLWVDKSKIMHPMQPQDWDETLQTIHDANVNLAGVYVWSNAIWLNQNKPHRIAPSMTDQELATLQIEFLTHTQQTVLGWSSEESIIENDAGSNTGQKKVQKRHKQNMVLPTFSAAYD